MPLLAAGLALVLLHRVDGGEVLVHAPHITSLHATAAAAAGQKNKLYTGEVRCVLGLLDGKLLSVLEPCAEVRRRMEGALP
jgi:hypothetical protein